MKDRSTWPRWTIAILLGMPVVYWPSFGPACWLVGRHMIPTEAAVVVYRPMLRLGRIAPISRAIERTRGPFGITAEIAHLKMSLMLYAAEPDLYADEFRCGISLIGSYDDPQAPPNRDE